MPSEIAALKQDFEGIREKRGILLPRKVPKITEKISLSWREEATERRKILPINRERPIIGEEDSDFQESPRILTNRPVEVEGKGGDFLREIRSQGNGTEATSDVEREKKLWSGGEKNLNLIQRGRRELDFGVQDEHGRHVMGKRNHV